VSPDTRELLDEAKNTVRPSALNETSPQVEHEEEQQWAIGAARQDAASRIDRDVAQSRQTEGLHEGGHVDDSGRSRRQRVAAEGLRAVLIRADVDEAVDEEGDRLAVARDDGLRHAMVLSVDAGHAWKRDPNTQPGRRPVEHRPDEHA
jgi:hypothetical protein